MIRRYGEPVKSGIRFQRRPGVYAMIRRKGDLLLTYQDDPHFEFQLPGGGIDPGESPLVALHREVMEETGWRIKIERRLGAFRRFTFMPEYDLWAEKVCQIFLASPVRPHGPPVEADHTAVWATTQEAEKLVENEGDAAFIRRFAHLAG